MPNRNLALGAYFVVTWPGGREYFAERDEAEAALEKYLAAGEAAELEQLKKRRTGYIRRKGGKGPSKKIWRD